MTQMDGDPLSQNSGDNSKCYALSHRPCRLLLPRQDQGWSEGEEAGTLLWRALNADNSGRRWEPFSVLDSDPPSSGTGLGAEGSLDLCPSHEVGLLA